MNKTKKILRIINTLNPSYGGSSSAIIDHSIALKKYSGKIIIRGGKSECKEGKPSPRTVIIEFSSINDAEIFYKSHEYQEAKKILGNSIKRNYQIIEGV